MMKKDDQASQSIQNIEEEMFLHHQHQDNVIHQSWSLPPVHHQINPVYFTSNPVRDHQDPFLVQQYPSSSSYPSLFNRNSTRAAPSLQFTYDGSISSDFQHLRIISEHNLGPGFQPVGSVPFGLQSELGKMTSQEIMDAKALVASKNHSEAERRRRERINNHFAKLRTLLPNTTKTDKASLLAGVIQHVKELQRQTSIISETSVLPTENDELIVDNASDEEGRFVIKASLCCEDRSDLLPDLIKTLKSLRLRTLKAEIATIGGRVRNVLFITTEEGSSNDVINVGTDDNNNNNNNEQQVQPPQEYCISTIHEALKAVMEKTGSGIESSSAGNGKRQKTNNDINIPEI